MAENIANIQTGCNEFLEVFCSAGYGDQVRFGFKKNGQTTSSTHNSSATITGEYIRVSYGGTFTVTTLKACKVHVFASENQSANGTGYANYFKECSSGETIFTGAYKGIICIAVVV